MNDERATNDQPIKVELHLHLSLGGEPRPDWRAWDGGVPYGPPIPEREQRRRGRWVGRTFGVLALVAVSIGAFVLAHRMVAAESGALLAAARLPPVVPPPTGTPHADSASSEAPSSGGDAHVVGSAGSRSGTAAFGLN